MSMQRVMGGRGLERGPRGSKRAHFRGTIVSYLERPGLSGQTSSRGSTKTASQWAWRVFHSVSERARCVGAAEPHRRQVCMVWQKRMKDGLMSPAHESGLTSLVPCTDRQADLTGSTTCASDVQTHGNPRQSPRRGERGVLYAERAGCTRGAGEVRGEDAAGLSYTSQRRPRVYTVRTYGTL